MAASAASQAFCLRQNLDAGRIDSARADEKTGSPHGAGRVGVKFAYYRWGVGAVSLIAGILKFVILK